MVTESRPFTVHLKYGDIEVDPAQVDEILNGGRIIRLNNVKGFYGRPFLYLNRKQQRHHRFRGPYDALRSTVYKKDWEGSSDDIEDSEKQKLLAFLSEHRMLLNWVASDLLSESDRGRFERTCRRLVKQMGKPISEIKVQILENMLMLPATEGADTAELLKATITLDETRLAEVFKITANLKWHALILLREITQQREVLEDALKDLRNLQTEREGLLQSYDRAEHFMRAEAIAAALAQAMDRPFRRVGRKTIKDLQLYVQEAGLNGSFLDAGKYLRRSILAIENFFRQSEIEGALMRIAHGQSYRGPKRQQLLAKARERVQNVASTLGKYRQEATELTNNPYGRVCGHLEDALLIWSFDEPDIDDIKECLEEAKSAL